MSVLGLRADTDLMMEERPDPVGRRFDDVTFEQVLDELRHPDTVEDEYWERIWALQRRATRDTFERCALLLNGPDGPDRRFGANVLGQLGCVEGYPFAAETLAMLPARLEDSEDEDALCGIAGAIGHLGHLAERQFAAQVLPRLTILARSADEDVRHAVVQAANGLTEGDDPVSRAAVAIVCDLSKDVDRDVRDWATFYLELLPEREIDLPEVRAALWERVTDEDQEVRVQAINGLAKYQDRTVLPVLLEELTAELVDEDALQWLDTFEAAQALPDPMLLPVLRRLEAIIPEDPWLAECRKAIEACEAVSSS